MYPIFIVIGIVIAIVAGFAIWKTRQPDYTLPLKNTSEQEDLTDRTVEDSEGTELQSEQTSILEGTEMDEQMITLGETEYGNEGCLMALAENEEEAQKISELYQIELVSFSYGVAVYQTDKNPHDVIKYGKEKGYPQLSINGKSYAN